MPAWTARALPAMVLALLLVAGQPALAAGPESFAPMIRRVLPAVVNIRITETVTSPDDPFAFLPPELQRQFREHFHARREKMQGAGSGFIIDPSGYIVTNNHVVGSADQITVDLSDGRQLPARVVGTDELTDIAVIRVHADGPLPAVSWGDSNAVEVGDWVVAAGNPFGLGGSISAGIVSARGRDIGEGPFDDFLQIDAPINPGNSGGPVFDEQGAVIGIDTAIASPTGASVGIGFAIPSEIARRIVSELREHGRVERGWLGVSLRDQSESDRTPGGSGALITAVQRNGPAQRGGLHPGDVITAVNGRPVESARGLIRQMAQAPPGSNVRLTLRRQRRTLDLDITVGRRPSGQG